MPSPLQIAAALLRQSAYTVALTGAGISTPSGIPDFRSPQAGMWAYSDPLEVASIWSFVEHPAAFYHWVQPLISKIGSARPNQAHQALAKMEAQGKLAAVITQNIDSLHQASGQQRVLEIHGHGRTATCLSCGQRTPADTLWSAAMARQVPPCCTQCGGQLKPDIVLFGEPLPAATLEQAQQEALRCEVMLVVGTSLEVMPAADLPLLARRRGARAILVNATPTSLDDQMDVVIRADVVRTLRLLLKGIGG